MSKHRHDHHASHPHATTSRTRRVPLATLGLTVGVVLCAAVFIWAPLGNRPSAPPRVAADASTPGAATQPSPDPQKLVGRWLRPDGGYVLEVKRVGGDRRLEVEYLNPRPINVSRAEMDQDGKKLRVFVELRDTGYPGCTYKLVYDAAQDQLTGTYFQAAIQEQFDVIFTRLK